MPNFKLLLEAFRLSVLIDDHLSLFVSQVEDHLLWLIHSRPVFFAASTVYIKVVGDLEYLFTFLLFGHEELVRLRD